MFFEKFREAAARLPAGLIRPGPAASPADIAATEAALGRSLPRSYADFLRSFDGADLFHEAVVLAGAGPSSLRGLRELNRHRAADGELLFAEVAGGDHYLFRSDGQVWRSRGERDGEAQGDLGESWHAGRDFAPWLEGLLAYYRVLYGSDGEFAPDAFEPDGTEVTATVLLKQTERALRMCPDSAEWQHERGVALRRLNRLPQAREAFATAVDLDPGNPWAHFDLGRASLDLGPALARAAGAAFEAAARLDADAAARLWTWAARAAALEAAPARMAQCRREALTHAPDLDQQLRRALDHARATGEPEEVAEAEALLAALEAPIASARVRLPVVQPSAPTGAVSDARAKPTRRAPPPARPGPARATPRRSAGPRRGRSR